jgi:SAM-dependent methyltransferase
MKKNITQHIYDFIFTPVRMFVRDNTVESLGLTSLEMERLYNILPHIEGRLLDIGCGTNRLCKLYGNGVGVEVFDWGGGAILLKNPHQLLFEDESFDTITMLASFNHIPDRKKMLAEVHRVLKKSGRVVITNIDPIIGYLVHTLLWHSEDKVRGMAEGEVNGLWNSEVKKLFEDSGFYQEKVEKYLYGLVRVHIYKIK